MTAIVVAALIGLIYIGISYYSTDIDQRFFHENHTTFKPSGSIGHGLGIVGTFLMLSGVILYMVRKRSKKMARLGILKHWLEFHIFLCILGPILILFHTAFKFGGIVAISFWSMVAVVLSGAIGRFIYIQIPKSIEGKQLSRNEIENLKADIENQLISKYKLDNSLLNIIEKKSHDSNNFSKREILKSIRKTLAAQQIKSADKKQIIRLVKQGITLNRRIKRLERMQKLFEYWHVVHLPFAILMIVILIIHVIVTILFGYKWIF